MLQIHNLARAWVATGVALALNPHLCAASLEDIQLWAGTGTQRAALVIEWPEGPEPRSLLWGFRWEGAATGLDMLRAVVQADPFLYAHLGQFGWGTAVFGLGYDHNQNGAFGVNPPLAFDAGGLAVDTAPDDARTPTDPGDLWREGWNTGFWAYYLKASETAAWESAMTGAADRTLSDGVWDGYRFAPGFTGEAPGEPVPAAVPEPAAQTLLVWGALLLAAGTRRSSRAQPERGS